MDNDPLAQLRDVQLPPEPSWWPPAVGWWVLTLGALVLVLWAIRAIIMVYRRKAPIRETKRQLTQLCGQFETAQISSSVYLNASNELLKRLLVRGLQLNAYAPLAGEQWLQALDKISGSQEFTCGAGRALGLQRFSANPEVDVPVLHALILKLLNAVKT